MKYKGTTKELEDSWLIKYSNTAENLMKLMED